MSAELSTLDNLRGWIRQTKRYPAAEQRRRLEAAGCGAIYEHARDGETVAELVRSLVNGDTVVVTTLARLGYTAAAVLERVAEIHSKGAHVLVLNGGYRSDRPKSWYKAVETVQPELNGERRTLTSAEAREFGSRGGVVAAQRRPRFTRAQRAEMLAIWRDRATYETTADACDAVRALIAPRIASDRTIARWLGRRSKGGGGRPRKDLMQLASEFINEARPKGRKK